MQHSVKYSKHKYCPTLYHFNNKIEALDLCRTNCHSSLSYEINGKPILNI